MQCVYAGYVLSIIHSKRVGNTKEMHALMQKVSIRDKRNKYPAWELAGYLKERSRNRENKEWGLCRRN